MFLIGKYSSHGTNVSLFHSWSKHLSGCGCAHGFGLCTQGMCNRWDSGSHCDGEGELEGLLSPQCHIQIPYPTTKQVFQTMNLREKEAMGTGIKDREKVKEKMTELWMCLCPLKKVRIIVNLFFKFTNILPSLHLKYWTFMYPEAE